MSAVVEVRNLRFRYPDGVEALRGVDFTLEAGEKVAILGANGSGKTSFLLHLVGLLRGDGAIRVCGRHLDDDSLAFVRGKVGLLFQDSDDQLFMPSVEEDVAFGPLNQKLSADEVETRTAAALVEVDMEELRERAPHHLSAGQKRRVALAGVLAMQPEVILLDEPATFLDPPARAGLIRILSRLPQAQVLVTHDVALASALADRAVFFDQGRIAADGPVDEVAGRFDWDSAVPKR